MRDRLWFGDVTSALTRLSLLLNSKLSADEFKKIDNFRIYIKRRLNFQVQLSHKALFKI